jgi:uncharacterized protein (DUF433 family)
MRDEQLLQRIDQSPRIMTGKPAIRGTRLGVEYIHACLPSAGAAMHCSEQ